MFDVSETVRTARALMKRRVESNQPALSGMFTRAEVTYAWPRDDGSVGSDREPVALFTGEAVHSYLGHLSDAAIVAMLNELATELGAALGRARIYVVRRTDVDFGCRRASRVTRGPGCWRRLYPLSERRIFVAAPQELGLHENALLGRRDILVVPPRCAETLVSSRSSFVTTP